MVHVSRFEQVWREGERAELEIECSAGTYVRSLVATLGDAYCEELRRLAIGPFSVEEADEDTLIPLDQALARLD
jgi:tRNA pseudouridine55 synthase